MKVKEVKINRPILILEIVSLMLLSALDRLEAADRFWVGGTGNWSNTARWSTTSGGGGGASVPGVNDKAIFDSSSGGGTCSFNQNVNIGGIDLRSGNTTTVSQGNRSLTVGSQNAIFTAGTFSGGSRNIDINGTFTLNGASFTSTSRVLTCGDTFTFSSGTFTHNSGEVTFDTNSFTITGSATFNDLTFNAATTFTIATGTTLTATGILTLTDGTVNGGAITAQDDIDLASTFDGGTTALTISGTANQTLTGGGSAAVGDFLSLTINKTGGTLTLDDTIRTGRDWTNSTPTRVDEGNSTLVFAIRDLTITGSDTYDNITFNGNATFTIATGTTLTADGTLTLTDGTVNGGAITAQDDIDLASTFDGGTTALTISGTANRTLTGGGSATAGDFLPLTINKTGGTLTLSSTIRTGRDWTVITPARVRAGTSTVVFGGNSLTINASMSFYNLTFNSAVTYTITAGTTLTVTNSLTLSGSSGSLVTLRSSVTGTQWSLPVDAAASYSASYVDVRDSNASAGRQIVAFSSTNSGNNTNWAFPSKLAFTTDSQTIVQNVVSSIIAVELQDSSGTAVTLPSGTDITVNLTSSSSGGLFSSNSNFTDNITNVTIAGGSSSASFYYKDSGVGTPIITASESPSQDFSDATQQETIRSSANTFVVSASSPQIAGSGFTLTITAKDADGATATSFSETVNLTVNYVSPISGTGTLSVTSTSSFSNGVATVSQTFSDCGTITITATKSDDSSISGTSSSILFIPYDFTVVPSAATQTVNKTFGLSITARNAQGAACPNYKGTANVSVVYVLPSTSQSGTLTPSSLGSADFTNGIASIAAAKYDKWGKIKIKVEHSTDVTRYGESQEIVFKPKDFLITLSTPPKSRNFYYKSEKFTVTVTARDQDNNSISNYQGTVELSSSDKSLTTTYTFLSTDSGAHNFSVNFSSAGKITLTVNDKTYTSITGSSAEFEVKEAKIRVVPTAGPVGNVEVRIEILDSGDKIISSDDSTTFTVSLSESTRNDSATSSTVTNPATIKGGAATIIVKDVEAETVTVTPASNPSLTPVAGGVSFGSFRGRGIGVDVWREIK